MALGSLPWRLEFHRFEDNKARFCLEPTSRRGQHPLNVSDNAQSRTVEGPARWFSSQTLR